MKKLLFVIVHECKKRAPITGPGKPQLASMHNPVQGVNALKICYISFPWPTYSIPVEFF